MTHSQRSPRNTTLAPLALAAALSSLAGAALAADTVIDAPSGPQVWAEGNFTIGTSGSIISPSFSPAITATSGNTLGTLTNLGRIDSDDPALVNQTVINALVNQGTISASSSAIVNEYGASLGMLSNSSRIEGGFTGIYNEEGGTIGAIVNTGLITGESAITNEGAIGTLTNSGTLSALDDPEAFLGALNSTGSIGTLDNSGLIAGPIGMVSLGQITRLHNTGTIQGSTAALVNGGLIETLDNAGTLRGVIGILNFGAIQTVDNSGTIQGIGAPDAVDFPLPIPGGIGVVIFSASTLPGPGGEPVTPGIATLNNSGLITGNTAALLLVDLMSLAPFPPSPDNAHPLSVLNNSGTIAGDILNVSQGELLINGAQDGRYGTFTGIDGAVGNILSKGAGVTFQSGKVLLNSHINTDSNFDTLFEDTVPTDPAPPSTPATVSNIGATVQVNTPITLTGDYRQAAAATLQIGVSPGVQARGDLASDAGYGRLVVSGAAIIEAGSAITLQKVNAFAFAPGQRYVVIDAASEGTQYNAGTLRYSVNDATSDVSGTAVADATRSRLVLTINSVEENAPPTPGTSDNNPATNPNARAALDGLARYAGVDDASLLHLFNAGQALRLGGADMANQAGNQLSPVQASALASVTQTLTRNVSDRIAQLTAPRTVIAHTQGSGIATGDARPALGAWGQVYGGHASQDRRDDVDGYGADFGGLMLGLDRAVGERWRLGGVLSYGNAKTDFKGDIAGNDAKIDSYGLAAYAGYTADRWYTTLSAGAYEQRYRTTRNIGFTGFSGQARGKFDGQQYVLRAEAGYLLPLGKATLTPLAALNYSYTRQDGYTESGGNGAALSVRSSNVTSITSDLGARIARNVETSYGTLSPELQLAWRHQYRNRKTLNTAGFAADPTGQTVFTTVGAAPVRDSALVSAGLTLHSSDTLNLSARYDLQAGGGFVSQAGGIRLRKQF
jgi:outer membrane autotransporter protein